MYLGADGQKRIGVSKAPASRRGERGTGAEGRDQRRTSSDMEVIVGLVIRFPSTEWVECRRKPPPPERARDLPFARKGPRDPHLEHGWGRCRVGGRPSVSLLGAVLHPLAGDRRLRPRNGGPSLRSDRLVVADLY